MPQMVELSKCPRPRFKRHPDKSLMDDLDGAFSHILYGVLKTQDVRSYIHVKIEEYNHMKWNEVWFNELTGEDFNLKLDYEVLIEKNVDV